VHKQCSVSPHVTNFTLLLHLYSQIQQLDPSRLSQDVFSQASSVLKARALELASNAAAAASEIASAVAAAQQEKAAAAEHVQQLAAANAQTTAQLSKRLRTALSELDETLPDTVSATNSYHTTLS
jgi:hypothetical protein